MAEQGHKAPIIVKKVKKISGGAHGGSWKVAYADFVTAMMAFFLLMWLLNMAPQEKQEQIAKYFQEFSIFEGGQPGIPMESGSMGPPAAVIEESSERPDGPAEEPGQGKGAGEAGEPGEGAGKKIEAQLQEAITEKLPDLEGQVQVSRDEQGRVRVEIMDKVGKPLFQSGGLALTPDARKVLATLTGVIKKDNLKVGIEGHTDATPYASANYTNWDLSTERALSARKTMVQDGLPPENIVMVAGYADSKLYDKANPTDPKNRRISLLLYEEPKGELARDSHPVSARPGQTGQAGQPGGNAQTGAAQGGASGQGEASGPITPLERQEEQDGQKQNEIERQIEKIYDAATDTPL